MQVQFTPGLLVMEMGTRFGTHEAERLQESVEAFAPVPKLVLDFTRVREFHDAALLALADALAARKAASTEVVLRGLTRHQARVLEYFGVVPAAPLATA